MTFDRESRTTDALLTDLYLDALLAGVVLDAATASQAGALSRLDPAARRAADRLRRDLVRVHPSFRFEERLATRLSEAGLAMRVPVAVGGEGRIVAFRSGLPVVIDPGLFPPEQGDGAEDGETALPAAADSILSAANTAPEADGTRRGPTRPLLIGGALTSAALSIAGAAFVAWRFGRPGRTSTPMARAARAVREARLASSVGSAVVLTARTTPRQIH